MKRQLLIVAITGLMAFGGTAAVSIADHEGPGPNGNNDHGLCTAYFNGQKNGHGKQEDGGPAPFTNLESHAEWAAEESGEFEEGEAPTGEDAVYWYCALQDGAAGIGGNPDNSGRWTCDPDGTEEDATDYCQSTPEDQKSNENGRTKGGGN